jgi:transposase
VLSLYNQKGPEAIPDGRHKNPGQKPLLSPELQEELRQALPHPRDGLWTGRSVAEWLCVPYNTAWEWLKRLGFSPLRPRPRHREADSKAQEEFKKTLGSRLVRGPKYDSSTSSSALKGNSASQNSAMRWRIRCK